ncbi:MAG: hypothetical protein ABI651_20230, partial [Verrucomicrobiota bacterium]
MRAACLCLALSLALLTVNWTTAADVEPPATRFLTNVWDRELSGQTARLFQKLPAPIHHYESLSQAEAGSYLRQDSNYAEIIRQKLAGRWFAALVAMSKDTPLAIQRQFDTWRGLVEFLAERNALVEVWAWGEGIGGQPRRLPAPELAELQRQQHEQPTFVTATYPDPDTAKAVTYRIEFGFQAGAFARVANEAYQEHRHLQLVSRNVLNARNSNGEPDALAQWKTLKAAVDAGQLALKEMPEQPQNSRDVWVACEYAVDDRNNFQRVIRFFRDSEIHRHV